MRILNYILMPTAVITLTTGCGSTLPSSLNASSTSSVTASTSSTTVTFTANLGTTSQVGRYRGSSMTSSEHMIVDRDSATPSASPSPLATISDQDLVTIDGSGNLSKVFSVSVPIVSVQSTTNYLIVDGEFTGLTDVNGNAFNCYLVAINKATSAMQCISTNQVGAYLYNQASSILGAPNFASAYPAYSRPGFRTRGSKVYFIDNANNILYSWTEGATSNTTVFSETSAQSGLSVCNNGGVCGAGMMDVFLDVSSANASNICVLNNAVNSFEGNVYCGTDAGNFTAVLTGTNSNAILAETNEMNNLVVSTSQTINLATFSVASRNVQGSNGGLPTSAIVNTGSDANNGLVGIGYAQSLVRVDASGNSYVLDDSSNSHYYQKLFIAGNYAWTVASMTESNGTNNPTLVRLARINLTTDALDSTNYISQAGMTSISHLTLSSTGGIRVDGLDGNGNAVIAYIDNSGNITVSSTSTGTLDLKVSLGQ